jgi:hypothetical protein
MAKRKPKERVVLPNDPTSAERSYVDRWLLQHDDRPTIELIENLWDEMTENDKVAVRGWK